MKSAIAFCLLAVLCTTDATLSILRLQIRNTKWGVESTIRQLERIRDNVDEDVKMTVMKKMLQQLEDYSKYTDPILDTIRKDVDDAKVKGKDAQQCYDAALNFLKTIDYESYIDARQCQKSAESSIKDNLSTFIDPLLTTGRDLIKELDNIFPDCEKKNSRFIIDTLKLISCIRNQLGISKVSVKNLKTDASSAGATAKSASKVVLQQATNCLNNVYSKARSKVPEAKSTATRCLNNM